MWLKENNSGIFRMLGSKNPIYLTRFKYLAFENPALINYRKLFVVLSQSHCVKCSMRVFEKKNYCEKHEITQLPPIKVFPKECQILNKDWIPCLIASGVLQLIIKLTIYSTILPSLILLPSPTSLSDKGCMTLSWGHTRGINDAHVEFWV